MSALPTPGQYALLCEYFRRTHYLGTYAEFARWAESERQRFADEQREREEESSDGASERNDGWASGRGAL